VCDDAHFFAGRRALVTGGASGIGRAVVIQLLRRGTRVVSLDVADQDDGPTPQFTPARVDLADAEQLQQFLDSLAGGDPVDLVCNAAGVSPLQQTAETVITVDFLAVRRICRHLVPRMPPGSAVVNVASVAALHDLATGVEAGILDAPDGEALAHATTTVPHPGLAYVVAKRAVIQLSRRLAAEHASRQVRVNTTSPHFAATPMHYAIKRADPGMYGDMPAPMGRWSSADEQADAVLFLLGPRASYVTGQNLVVDGGWQAVTSQAQSGSH
jgi:NAD(P)-dependent dehydrogenase (short-subunit alcohol dehydrogenase family)